MTLSLVTLAVMIMEYLERLMHRVTGQKGNDHLNVGGWSGGEGGGAFTHIYMHIHKHSGEQ